MRAGPGLAVLVAVLAQGALGAPESSPRPPERPSVAAEAEVVQLAAIGAVRPPRRPAVQGPLPPETVEVRLVAAGLAIAQSPRPPERPQNLRRKAVVRAAGLPIVPDPGRAFGKAGAICGVPSIKGSRRAAILGRVAGCGVAEPVEVTSVQGVALSTPEIMDCTTARALDAWVKGAVLPSVGRLGGGVASLQVAAHYSCRPRNGVKGARVSEHGKGHAIDIAAIVLKNGVALSVLKGWNDSAQGKILKAVHRAACGPFGTVLGPGSDAHHRDHIHLDTARYRSGSYCR